MNHYCWQRCALRNDFPQSNAARKRSPSSSPHLPPPATKKGRYDCDIDSKPVPVVNTTRHAKHEERLAKRRLASYLNRQKKKERARSLKNVSTLSVSIKQRNHDQIQRKLKKLEAENVALLGKSSYCCT
jgi:hypothetical protein